MEVLFGDEAILDEVFQGGGKHGGSDTRKVEFDLVEASGLGGE